MRLLVIGAAGMLGQDLLAAAQAAGHEPVGLDLPELDITDAGRHARRGRATPRPDAVVNCAAWTDVDGAEEQEELAARVNARGRGQRRRRRGRRRRARDPDLDGLLVRRHGDRAVHGVEPDQRARRLRPHQARRRARRRRGRDAGLRDRPQLVAVRPARQELRRHDPARSAPSATRSRSSTTRSAARPTPATSRRRSSRSPSAA